MLDGKKVRIIIFPPSTPKLGLVGFLLSKSLAAPAGLAGLDAK